MSTILKALRRLEHEKSTRSDRPLGEAVAGAAPIPTPRAAASRRWPKFAGIAIGLIVLGVAAFATIRWNRGDAESPPVEVAAVAEKPETPVVPGRKVATPARPKANARKPSVNRRQRPVRNSPAKPAAPSPPPPDIEIPDVAVVERSEPTRFGASRIPAATALPGAPGSGGAQSPGAAPVAPPSGASPTIDLSDLEALRDAAKAAGKPPRTVESARVEPTSPTTPSRAPSVPSAPTPEATSRESTPEPAPVEVAAARPAAPPAPPPAPKVEPEAKPEAPPERSFARKSPPRPSGPHQPEVYVSRTVWHPDASRRVAYVEFDGRDEMIALREGDSIGPLTVTEIAPTGVSFDNRGSEFTRRVGAR